MSGPNTQAKVKARVDKALEEKDLGNAAFKSGDHQLAIKHYYNVILNLKGLATGASMKHEPIIPASKLKRDVPSKNTITELSEGDDSQDNSLSEPETPPPATPPSHLSPAGGNEKGSTLNEDPTEKEKYTDASIKNLMATCYVNMCICHAKKNAWPQCKRNAESALVCEPENFKAKFRVAQATVRLGEVSRGRTMLLDLQKVQDDPAIANELKVLDAAEAAREKKSNATFRGFINKANPPKISEIAEDVAVPVETTKENQEPSANEHTAAILPDVEAVKLNSPPEDA